MKLIKYFIELSQFETQTYHIQKLAHIKRERERDTDISNICGVLYRYHAISSISC